MKILLYAEKSLRVDLKAITENLNAICKYLKFQTDANVFQISSHLVSYPSSYQSLSAPILRKAKTVDSAMLFTGKQYYNNYFYEEYGNKAIVSFFGWQDLTNLSRNNGVVYFIADLIALRIDDSFRHDDMTGCIYDFGWSKTGIDLEMRDAFICASCLRRISAKKLSKEKRGLFDDLREILDVLGKTSKWNKDIVTYWKSLRALGKNKSPDGKREKSGRVKAQPPSKYDVFLAHNSSDKPFVESINSELKKRGLKPWLDKETVAPGRLFQDVIQETIRKVSSAAIFIGRGGLGRWQIVELRTLISQCVDRSIPVIPVLLPGVKKLPPGLVFLNEFSWIKFVNSADEEDAMDNLVWGITGKHPKRS